MVDKMYKNNKEEHIIFRQKSCFESKFNAQKCEMMDFFCPDFKSRYQK